MWICFSDSFVSVVADRDDPAGLLVRARRKQDLVNFLGQGAEILETPLRDYRWRAFVRREDFQKLIVARIDQITYPHFTHAVRDGDLHDMYIDFWTRHRQYQEEERPGRRAQRRGHYA